MGGGIQHGSDVDPDLGVQEDKAKMAVVSSLQKCLITTCVEAKKGHVVCRQGLLCGF